MEDVRNSIPWKKPFIPKTGKEESNTNRKPERAVEISNHLHFFQAIIFQILNVCDEMQYVKRRTCSIEIEENAKLSTTTILGLKEITLMYVLNVIFPSMSDEAHTCICKTVYELNHLKIHKIDKRCE